MRKNENVLKAACSGIFTFMLLMIFTGFAGTAVGALGAQVPVTTESGDEDIEEIEEIEEVREVSMSGRSIIGPLVLILGIVNLLLIFFQLCTGLRYVKVHFGIHRKSGIILLCTALVHGILAWFY